jgi:hypothetical protein
MGNSIDLFDYLKYEGLLFDLNGVTEDGYKTFTLSKD